MPQNLPSPAAHPRDTRPALLDREIENSREMLGQKSVNTWAKESELLTPGRWEEAMIKKEGENNYTTLPLESEKQKIPSLGVPVSEDVRETCISHSPCVQLVQKVTPCSTVGCCAVWSDKDQGHGTTDLVLAMDHLNRLPKMQSESQQNYQLSIEGEDEAFFHPAMKDSACRHSTRILGNCFCFLLVPTWTFFPAYIPT